jgi:hypothetical protein
MSARGSSAVRLTLRVVKIQLHERADGRAAQRINNSRTEPPRVAAAKADSSGKGENGEVSLVIAPSPFLSLVYLWQRLNVDKEAV